MLSASHIIMRPDDFKLFVRIARIYFNTTWLYGFVRTTTYDHQGVKKYYNKKTATRELKDMLLADKIARITTHTLAAPALWPIMLAEDATRFECFMRGKDPNEYK
jgi:hypothetical protein